MIRKIRWVAWAVMGAALFACSSDDKPAPSGGGAVESCSSVCQKQADQNCPNPFMITADQCKQLCAAVVMAGSDACKAEIKARSDCQLMQQDICKSETACAGDGGTACM